MRRAATLALTKLAAMAVAAMGLAGCASHPPPEAPPSPPADLTFHGVGPAIITDATPETEVASSGEDGALVLPNASDVVVVHVRRMLELELNPLLLMLARQYVKDDCLLSGLLSVERAMVSHDDSGWVAAVDGDDTAKTVFECLGKSDGAPVDGRLSVEVFGGLRAMNQDGVLLVGTPAALDALRGSHRSSGKAGKALALLPRRDDTLIEVGSVSAISGAPSESSGYVAGKLERLRLHADTTVHDPDVARIIKLFPMLEMALRPALEEMIGDRPEVEVLAKLLDELEVEQKGDTISLDLVVEDLPDIIRSLTGKAIGATPAQTRGGGR